MFKKKKQAGLLPGQDAHQLLEAMDKIANGNFEEADVTQFKNPVYAEKINAMLHAFKNANNPVVMRLNETMGVIGDNTLIKDTLDQVETQTKSIQDMESASRHLENSIENISEAMGHIRDNTHEILSSSQNVTNDMNDSIEAVTQSSTRIQTINDRVQDFKGKIGKIEEIVDLVKKVANQSNLLALNASVEAARAGEAGRGFSVVATEISGMATQTKDATGNIAELIQNVSGAIGEVVTVIRQMIDGIGSQREGTMRAADSFTAIEDSSYTIVDNLGEMLQTVEALKTANQEIVDSIQTISATTEEVSAHASETLEAEERNREILQKITENMNSMVKK